MTDYVLENWKKYLKEDKKMEEDAKNHGAGFIIISNSGEDVLLIRRSEGSNLGELTGPGGGMEAGESPFETAVRETKEEIQKSFEGREPEGSGYVREQNGFTFTTFLMHSVDNFDCKLNNEHDAWGWVDIEQVEDAIVNNRELVSNKFKDRDNKPIKEVRAKIFHGVADAIKHFTKNFK